MLSRTALLRSSLLLRPTIINIANISQSRSYTTSTTSTSATSSSSPPPPTDLTPSSTSSSPLTTTPTESQETARKMQAPNRATTWSKRQAPRELAMTGPRFEQTDMELQPRPHAAIELIHQQPVRWVATKVAVCSGEVDGSAGHPKIFINVDKAEIVPCGYCGLPFANEHHREHLEAQPSTPYPLN